MAAIVTGTTLIGVTLGKPLSGFLDIGTSTPAPPGPPIPAAGVTFTQTTPPPGPFAISDAFTGPDPSIINGRLVNGTNGTTFTPSANYPTGYTWNDAAGGASDIITGGSATVINNISVRPFIQGNQEYNMSTGIFLEFKFNAPTTDTPAVVGFEIGSTAISLVGNTNDTGHENRVRIDANGFNGYTNPDGTALPPAPGEPAKTGTYSASFTLDRYYTGVTGDWRNKVLRAELTETSLRLYVDGVLVIDQVPRFTVQLFASSAYVIGSSNTHWSLALGLAQMECGGGAPDPITIDYIQVGAL